MERGASWSSGHALVIPIYGCGSASWGVLHRRSVPNKTSRTEWAEPATQMTPRDNCWRSIEGSSSITETDTRIIESASSNMLPPVKVRGTDAVLGLMDLQYKWQAHGRDTSGRQILATCSYRMVRCVTLTCALPDWTPQKICQWIVRNYGPNSSLRRTTPWHSSAQLLCQLLRRQTGVAWSSGVVCGLLTLRLWYRFGLIFQVGSGPWCPRYLTRCGYHCRHTSSANQFFYRLCRAPSDFVEKKLNLPWDATCGHSQPSTWSLQAFSKWVRHSADATSKGPFLHQIFFSLTHQTHLEISDYTLKICMSHV